MALEPIANKQRGEIIVTLGDQKIVLVPSFDNIQSVESLIGRSFLKVASEFVGKRPSFSANEVANIIYVCQKTDPKLSFNKIGKLLEKYGVMKALIPIAEFMDIALNGSELKNDESEEKTETQQ